MDYLTLLNYPIYLMIFAVIYGCLAIALNVQWGYAGLFNAGIVGFFAVGAYTSAILTSPPVLGRVGGFGLPVPLGLLGAVAITAAVAWPIGKVCLRFRSDYLAIVTIGFAEAIRLVCRSEEWLTNGTRGIINVPRPFGDLPYTQSLLAYLALGLVVLGLVYVLVERQVSAPWGRMMRAIRDNETAAVAMGKDVPHRRMEAFVMGAALMGLTGALYVHFMRVITPEAIDPMIVSFLVWIMVILGGSGNNRGVLLGALIVWILWSMSELLTDRLPADVALQAKYGRMFLVGLLLQLVLRVRPEGILPEEIGKDKELNSQGKSREESGANRLDGS